MTFDIATLPAPAPAPAASDETAIAQSALADWLTTYLKGKYRISGQRFFVDGPDGKWVAVESAARSAIERRGGVRVDQDWRRPGYDLVATWKLQDESDAPLVAAAMAYDPLPDGRRLIGYFSLVEN